MLTFQNYKRPQTLEEAWTLNQSKSARLAAGMMWMRMGDAHNRRKRPPTMPELRKHRSTRSSALKSIDPLSAG